MSRRDPGPQRRQVTAVATWFGSVATATSALIGALGGSGVFIVLAAAGTFIATLVAAFVERAPQARITRAWDARPAWSFLPVLGAVGVILCFMLGAWAMATTYLDSATPEQKAAAISAGAVVVTSAIDPLSGGWRHSHAASAFRFARNFVLAFTSAIVLTLTVFTSSG